MTTTNWARPGGAALAVLALVCGPAAAGDQATDPAATGAANDVRLQVGDIPTPELVDVDEVVAEQLAEARREFDAVIADPALALDRLADSYGAMGQLYHAYELFDPAAASYRNAIALAPMDARWHHLLADVLRRQRLPDAAAEAYQAAWTLDPFDFAALVRLGEVQLEVGRLDEAESAFRSALQLIPAASSALAGLGQVALARRDFERAVSYLEAALRAVPEANRLHYPLAMAYRGLGDMEQAKQHLELRGSVGLKPPDPLVDELESLTRGERVPLVRGRVAFAAGRFEEAAELFRQAVEAEPTSVVSRVNLGTALARLGDTEGAIEQYRRTLELDPEYGLASYNLGSLLVAAGRPAEAVEPLEVAVRQTPNDAEAQLLLARALAARGDDEAALEHFRKTFELDPLSEDAVVGGAATLVRLERYGIARSVLESGLERMPSSGRIAFSLARILAVGPDPDLRDGQRALELAYQIYNAAPNPRHAQLIAQSLAQLDRCEEAAEWQRQVYDAGVDQGVADEILGAVRRSLERYGSGPPCAEPSSGFE